MTNFEKKQKTEDEIKKTFTEEELILIHSLVDEKKGFTIKFTINHFLKMRDHL